MSEEISEEYKLLFHGMTDTIAALEQLAGRLKMYQQEAEEIFIEGGRQEQKPVFAPQSDFKCFRDKISHELHIAP